MKLIVTFTGMLKFLACTVVLAFVVGLSVGHAPSDRTPAPAGNSVVGTPGKSGDQQVRAVHQSCGISSSSS